MPGSEHRFVRFLGFAQKVLPPRQQVWIQLPVTHQVFDLGIAQTLGIPCRNHVLGCLRLEEGHHLRVTAKTVFPVDLLNAIEPLLISLLLLRKSDRHAEQRELFERDEASWMGQFGLTADERRLIAERDWIELWRRGMSIYTMIKLIGVTGTPLVEIGKQMRERGTREMSAHAGAGTPPSEEA